MFSLIPFGLAPLIAGRTFDVTQSYTLAYLGFAALFVIAAAGLTQMRIRDEEGGRVLEKTGCLWAYDSCLARQGGFQTRPYKVTTSLPFEPRMLNH